MRNNGLKTRHIISTQNAPTGDLSSTDTLGRSLGYSISATEIQHRGNEAPLGTTLLDSIPQHAVTHLRVLAETSMSYLSIGGLRLAGDNTVAREFSVSYEGQHYQLFLRNPYAKEARASHIVFNSMSFEDHRIVPLLMEDVFVFLTEASLCLSLVDEIDIMHLVRLCYLAEIVKVIVMLHRNSSSTGWEHMLSKCNNAQFVEFCNTIKWYEARYTTDSVSTTFDSVGETIDMVAFVQKYALAFLRKVVILLHVRYGVAFHNHVPGNAEATELARLTETLRLPSFEEMCNINPTSSAEGSTLNHLVSGWITHLSTYEQPKKLTIAHPTIFELIGLPKNYDTLMEETMKRRCPTTGKDVSDPMLCLFCGDIFCAQSICCLKEGPARPGKRPQQIGGAQQHMLK